MKQPKFDDLYPLTSGHWRDISFTYDDTDELRRFVDDESGIRCIVIREPFLPPRWHGFVQATYQSSGYPGIGEYMYLVNREVNHENKS